jgi:NAD-specific glutamate dehydrogenase
MNKQITLEENIEEVLTEQQEGRIQSECFNELTILFQLWFNVTMFLTAVK